MHRVIERARGGDPLSQARVMERLRSRIDRMAAYFGKQFGADPDDLQQEAWLAVLEMLPRLDVSIGEPEQHLLKRARWRILDSIRRQRRRETVPLSDVPAGMAYSPPPQPGLDMDMLQARLTLTQRRIVRMLLEGYTWREAGAMLGCTSANVAYHVRKIRQAYCEINAT